MNRQETYDRVAQHLLTQNAKSMAGVGHCSYRGENGLSGKNGLKCAIGCLIPDEVYSRGIERASISCLWATARTSPFARAVCQALGIETVYDAEFLQRLQNIHDSYGVTEWPRRLFLFAQNESLMPYASPPVDPGKSPAPPPTSGSDPA